MNSVITKPVYLSPLFVIFAAFASCAQRGGETAETKAYEEEVMFDRGPRARIYLAFDELARSSRQSDDRVRQILTLDSSVEDDGLAVEKSVYRDGSGRPIVLFPESNGPALSYVPEAANTHIIGCYKEPKDDEACMQRGPERRRICDLTGNIDLDCSPGEHGIRGTIVYFESTSDRQCTGSNEIRANRRLRQSDFNFIESGSLSAADAEDEKCVNLMTTSNMFTTFIAKGNETWQSIGPSLWDYLTLSSSALACGISVAGPLTNAARWVIAESQIAFELINRAPLVGRFANLQNRIKSFAPMLSRYLNFRMPQFTATVSLSTHLNLENLKKLQTQQILQYIIKLKPENRRRLLVLLTQGGEKLSAMCGAYDEYGLKDTTPNYASLCRLYEMLPEAQKQKLADGLMDSGDARKGQKEYERYINELAELKSKLGVDYIARAREGVGIVSIIFPMASCGLTMLDTIAIGDKLTEKNNLKHLIAALQQTKDEVDKRFNNLLITGDYPELASLKQRYRSIINNVGSSAHDGRFLDQRFDELQTVREYKAMMNPQYVHYFNTSNFEEGFNRLSTESLIGRGKTAFGKLSALQETLGNNAIAYQIVTDMHLAEQSFAGLSLDADIDQIASVILKSASVIASAQGMADADIEAALAGN